jgi:hypothetical protein
MDHRGERNGHSIARAQYAPGVEPIEIGELVKVAGPGPELDGIVFDTPSDSKVVVAVVDPVRGPLFRSVSPKTLTSREKDGPDDRALQLLIRRTPQPSRGGPRSGSAAGTGRSGFTRGASHRTTGR